MRHGLVKAFSYALFSFFLLNQDHKGKVVAGSATCKDVNGLFHETGYHYIPGPEPCTLCICDNGNPTLCKAVFCKYKDQEVLPNKDCKTFRFGNTCCEVTFCLDNAVSSTTNDKVDGNGTSLVDGSNNYDLGLRLVISCITALLSLGLLIFLIHRLRQRKIRAGRQTHQIAEDQRSLGSMGYLDRNSTQHGMPLDDLPCNGNYPLWKPPSNYFPRGEAPPPYEEAVAAARAEQALLSMSSHTLSPLTFPGTYLNHETHTNVSIVANSQNGLPASSPTLSQNNATSSSQLIVSNNRPLSSPAAHNCYQLNQTESSTSGFCTGTCTTRFSLQTNTYENLPTPINRSALSNSSSSIIPQHTPPQINQLLLSSSTQNSSVQNYQQHGTLPHQSGAYTISATLPNSSVGNHRTIPKTLATSGSLRLRKDYPAHQLVGPLFDTPLELSKNVSEDENSSGRSAISSTISSTISSAISSAVVPPTVIPSSVPSILPNGEAAVRTSIMYDSSCSQNPPTLAAGAEIKSPDVASPICNYKPSLARVNQVNEEGSFDSVICTCSAQALPPLHDDTDDYRSECENCKSATGSRYYLDNEDEMVTSPHETMTLHRRPEDGASNVTPQYYRTSLTLPTSTRQRTRSTSSRGNWFNEMPESSSESSDGE